MSIIQLEGLRQHERTGNGSGNRLCTEMPPLVLFSLITVGFASNALGGAGGPLAVYFVAIIAAEAGKMISKETKIRYSCYTACYYRCWNRSSGSYCTGFGKSGNEDWRTYYACN